MMEQLKDERLRLREQNHFLDLLVSVSPMGLIILTLDGHVSMINAAALRYLDYVTDDEVKGRLLCELTSPLAEEIERIPKDASKTVRLSDSMIYRCSRLSFVDRGFAHPFILIESLTSEVVKAEKKAYEKVIRMIAHEVNNTVAGITSTLDTVDGALECMDDTEDLREVMKVCVDRCYSMSRLIPRVYGRWKVIRMDCITNFANVVKSTMNDRVAACKMFMEAFAALNAALDFLR